MNGVKFEGEVLGDAAGVSVSGGGDINGDAYVDLLIGAFFHNNKIGRSYVVFGGPTIGGSGVISLASLNGVNGFKLDGEVANDQSGTSVNITGDINGDNWNDLLIGAPGHNDNTGRSYVVFGGPGVGSSGLILLSDLNGINGFKLDGEMPGDFSGLSVSRAGDINGDAYDDLVIGAYGYSSAIGRSYVIFGGLGIGSNGLISLANLNGINGFKLDGEFIGDASGWSVSAAEDINGDGVEDIIIGAPGHNSGTGRSYVVFGGAQVGSTGILSLSNLNGNNGFKLDGETQGDGSGLSVSRASDINGDKRGDLVIGARYHNNYVGRSYVVFSNPPSSNDNFPLSLVIGIAAGVAGCLALLGYCIYRYRQKPIVEEPITQSLLSSEQPISNQPINLESKSKKPSNRSSSPKSPYFIDPQGEFKISLNIPFKELKYSEQDKLGEGAYGKVYRGEYEHNQVAIKELHAKHFSRAALDEFRQEAGIMASMRSDYIVDLRGICLETPHFCMVMELMPKGSLNQLLMNPPPDLSLSKLLRIGLDVIYGLKQLHNRNILHRDLKSLNVLLDDRLRAKISDFGLSKVKSEVNLSSTKEAKAKGTLGWMAPELFEEKPKATQAADIYAYGMILWELIAKPYRTPFQGLVPAQIIAAKITRKERQEEIPPSCSHNLAALMLSCWKKPKARPSASQVADSLRTIFAATEQKSASVAAPVAAAAQSMIPSYGGNLTSR